MKSICKLILLAAFLGSASAIFAQDAEREKGIELYNAGEYQKSAETLQKVVISYKDDAVSRLYLGMSQARLKNNKQAIEAFKEADKIFTGKKQNPNEQVGVKITAKPRPSYTNEARQNNTQGVVKIGVEFGADGKIKAIVPFQTLPDGLTVNCIQAAKQVKFDPALKNGKPYSTIGILSYSFEIY